MGPLVLLVVVATTIWVGFDAQARDFSHNSLGSGTSQWVLGTLLLWLIVFPIYLVARGRVPLRAGSAPPVLPPPTSGAVPAKVCPDCAEQVRPAARKCRFCGFRFLQEIA